MGTPLKPLSAILSPRLLTSKSPNILLSIPKSRQFVNNFPKNSRVSKNLFVENAAYVASPQVRVGRKLNCVENFQINTPNKNDLLRKGTDDKILNILGKGSFGIVFKATFKDKTVAAKVVNKKCAQSEQNASKLTHENIVEIYEIIVNEHEKYALVLMEYMQGTENLQQFLNNNNDTNLKIVLNFAKDIARGIAYCHKNDIAHLDLKPKNILVHNRKCKICDFGNSMNLSKSDFEFLHQGTVAYTAPEILIGNKPSTKSDIYSLGIIFWQMRHKTNPYDDIDNNETVIYQVVKCSLRPKYEKISDTFENIYVQCWNSDLFERPEAVEVLNMLEGI